MSAQRVRALLIGLIAVAGVLNFFANRNHDRLLGGAGFFIVVAVLGVALILNLLAAALPAATSDLIRTENSKAGTDWQLTNVKLDGRNQFRTRLIEGYCSRQSIAAGQTLQIMVSANPPGKFQIEIFRMGYYGGRGARRFAQLGPFEGKTQPEPPIAPRRHSVRQSLRRQSRCSRTRSGTISRS